MGISKVEFVQLVELNLVVLVPFSKLSLQNFHTTRYIVFSKPDWRSTETFLEKSGLYSSMQFHLVLRTVKTAALYLIPIKSDSENNHPSINLKWTLILVISLFLLENFSKNQKIRSDV